MRILFFLTLTSLVRHFESVVLALAARGHSVRIATPGHETNWPLPAAFAGNPGISEVTCPEGRSDEWAGAARLLRLLADYLRYLEPPFLEAEKLRARARAELARALAATGEAGSARRPDGSAIDDAMRALGLREAGAALAELRALLRLTERALPSDAAHDRFLADERPDVVLVTPLVSFGSPQVEWVKSARKLGIPVGFPVFSWDNLTTKGLVHEQPDRVFVWNDIQKREAVQYHGVCEETVDVTGAPRFDAFCRLTPKRNRHRFCEKYGLRPDQPIVTYLCSSEFVAEQEAAFVERWIDEVRRDAALASCNVVVRPHPRSEAQWMRAGLAGRPHVAVTMPKAMNADRLLYDTLYHSAAVVGLNTSAQIEAALLGKPVLTMLAPGFERGQQGTLHFRYLLEEEGGFVRVAPDFETHRGHLKDAVGGTRDTAAARAFIERFVRPAGLDRPATPVLVEAIERLHSGAGPRAKRWWSGLGA